MTAFARHYAVKRIFLVGQQGIPVEEFLQLKPEQFF